MVLQRAHMWCASRQEAPDAVSGHYLCAGRVDVQVDGLGGVVIVKPQKLCHDQLSDSRHDLEGGERRANR